MVSGLKPPLLERRRIVSGDAKLIVIFEKFDFTLLSFLKPFFAFGFSDNKILSPYSSATEKSVTDV